LRGADGSHILQSRLETSVQLRLKYDGRLNLN
jgi:hypothetical protein